MDYEATIRHLENDGFSWSKFRVYFPFGDINLREGNFQKLVLKILESLEGKKQKELLLDMIDTQNCIFLEQVWLQNEQYNDQGEEPFPVHGHFITAQLQITSNIRWEMNLKRRDPRGVMLKLPETELLIDRITFAISDSSGD